MHNFESLREAIDAKDTAKLESLGDITMKVSPALKENHHTIIVKPRSIIAIGSKELKHFVRNPKTRKYLRGIWDDVTTTFDETLEIRGYFFGEEEVVKFPENTKAQQDYISPFFAPMHMLVRRLSADANVEWLDIDHYRVYADVEARMFPVSKFEISPTVNFAENKFEDLFELADILNKNTKKCLFMKTNFNKEMQTYGFDWFIVDDINTQLRHFARVKGNFK